MDGHHHDGEYSQQPKKSGKLHNVLPLWGNESTMNLNALILANIQSSSYFKVHLFKLKTYHEVVDEIYYQVKHLEPWERGSRKTAGQTGMCGGVRGVGAGGIVSTAYCLLYKLYTLRLTRKQLNGLLTHTDSPYIRCLGFMYIRYSQPPADLFDWYEEYLQDDEEVEAKAGGGVPAMTIGQMLHQFLVKLEWFSTLFPRIPVPIQKQIEKRLADYSREHNITLHVRTNQHTEHHHANGGPGHGRPGGSGGGREYFDASRNRDRDQRGGGGGGATSSSSGCNSARFDQRTVGDDHRSGGGRGRSRSRERSSSHRADRFDDRDAYSSSNSGRDKYSRRDRDDGYTQERGNSERHTDRHRDRNYR